MDADVFRRAPFGVASVVIVGAVYVYLLTQLVVDVSAGSSMAEALVAVGRMLTPFSGSLALAPVLLSLPLGVVSLLRRERPRWGLWGVILSVVLLLAAAVAFAVFLGLVISAATQNG